MLSKVIFIAWLLALLCFWFFYSKTKTILIKKCQPLLPTPWQIVNGQCVYEPTLWRRCDNQLVRSPTTSQCDPPLSGLHVGVITFATGNYMSLLGKFLQTGLENMLPHHKVTFYVFTDRTDLITNHARVVANHVPHLNWPASSMQRFDVIAGNRHLFERLDYVFSLDVDYYFATHVCDDYLGDLVAFRHPGWPCDVDDSVDRPFETRPVSTAYLPPDKRMIYYMGNQFGGRPGFVHALALNCSANQNIDNQNGIKAVWDDESHLNRYLAYTPPDVILSSSYYGYPKGNVPFIHEQQKNHQYIRLNPATWNEVVKI